MQVKELTIYECPECHDSWKEKHLAEYCLSQHKPKVCDKCGGRVDKYHYRCRDCSERSRFNNANKITLDEYDKQEINFIFDPVTDQYYDTIDYMWEYYKTCHPELTLPNYVWACETEKYCLDAEYILDNSIEYDDQSYDRIVNPDDFINFVDEWNKKQTMVSYSMDYDVAVLVDWSKFNNELFD